MQLYLGSLSFCDTMAFYLLTFFFIISDWLLLQSTFKGAIKSLRFFLTLLICYLSQNHNRNLFGSGSQSPCISWVIITNIKMSEEH